MHKVPTKLNIRNYPNAIKIPPSWSCVNMVSWVSSFSLVDVEQMYPISSQEVLKSDRSVMSSPIVSEDKPFSLTNIPINRCGACFRR